MASISQSTNAMSNASKDGIELNKVLSSMLADMAALKVSIGNLNAKMDALGNVANSTVGALNAAAGTTNVSGNTPAIGTTA